ncbi:MAG TPA: hypothetical protein VK064_06225 [Wenzhouxiangella sp.]|nr:hypothetical protein [Wenzhouxiangella sp.]
MEISGRDAGVDQDVPPFIPGWLSKAAAGTHRYRHDEIPVLDETGTCLFGFRRPLAAWRTGRCPVCFSAGNFAVACAPAGSLQLY